ncbi:MAG: thioredoxin [Weeksellaceae bacterium]
MTFNEITQQDKPVLVNFFATWCAPCAMMAPILEEVKKRVGGKSDIIKIDVDKNPNAAAAFKIRSVPSLMVFKKGEMMWKQAGLMSADEIIQKLNRYMDV